MAQDQIQSLKIEISKKARLKPYERITFHKILGINKTEIGMQVLLKELYGNSIVRESAILTLKNFNYKEVQIAFLELLKQEIRDSEKIDIFEHLKQYGTAENVPGIIEFIENNKLEIQALPVISKAFSALMSIGGESDDLEKFLTFFALNKEYSDTLRSYSIFSLSSFKNIVVPISLNKKSFLEEILREDSEELLYAAYSAMSILNDNIMDKMKLNRSDEDELFTYSPEHEDRAILDIRVLIGKMTSQFDLYSNKIKIAYINAMISSNHRELLIYTMKALTSNDTTLIDMTLDLLFINVHKLIAPDKLFRNLIALSIDSHRGNDIIVDIFARCFDNLKETRKNELFKDKLYNYIVVTLETYFETYRKNFMIAEVIEKNYPENFQRIRCFVLNKFTPDYKKKLLNFLRSSGAGALNLILAEISKLIPYIDNSEKQDLTYLLDVLYEKDIKSREISATRIEDINFDKRYLKDRIIRLCNIIGKLKIDNAASQLVIIYNYIKKYTDPEILDVISYTLSMLNYSYMLGELEVLLSTGDENEQQKAIQYLSLFSDQRSLNIILDYLKQNSKEEKNIIIKLLNTLLRQDIFNNVSANSTLKEIIELNSNHDIKRLAILCLGKCARETDIEYLNEKFSAFSDNDTKESIVQSIEHIVDHALDVNIRAITKLLFEYLKDPGIKVRIYSCYLLIKLGNKNALKSIMDMMTIKNKNIQREIISIFGNIKSVEFAYFLISLMKDEYAISSDIIPLLSLLPQEEIKEIDHFITNIFKKHEFIDIKDSHAPTIIKKIQNIENLIEKKSIILNIEILNFKQQVKNLSIIEITMMYKQIDEMIISVIQKARGIITRITQGRILAYYDDPQLTLETALEIFNNFKIYNRIRLPANRINISIQLISSDIKIINEEIIILRELKINYLNTLPLKNRILLDSEIKKQVEDIFYSAPLPELVLKNIRSEIQFHDLLSPLNFLELCQTLLKNLSKEVEEKEKREIELESESKKQKQESKSPTAIAYAQALDDIGRILKDDLSNVGKYIQKRTTDRELINNVEKMLSNVYKRYFVEKSKIFIEIE